MLKRLVGILLIAAASTCAWAQKAPAVLEMNADGEVQIGPDGHVSDYRLQSQLPVAIANLVDRDVRKWQFEPIQVEGTRVTARTAMHMHLRAEPVQGNDSYEVRITHIRFGGPRAHNIRLPRYLQSAIAARVGARVVLALRLDDSGDVTEAQVYQTSLNIRINSEMQAEAFRKIFEQASLEAAHDWHYELSETLNGKRIATVALVPVVFNLTGKGMHPTQDGEWSAYAPGPVHSVPWLRDDRLASNAASLRNGEAASTDSHFHLKQDVVGKTL